jgi:hypothetical protein
MSTRLAIGAVGLLALALAVSGSGSVDELHASSMAQVVRAQVLVTW